jgi:Tfp pilus assembly protein PilN
MRAVNLIPGDERRGVSVGGGRSGGAAYILLGAFGVLVVLVLLYGLARHQVGDRKSKLASLAAQTQQAQESASALSPYTSFMALREQRMKAVEQVVDSRFDWAHAFHELGRVLPEDASITSLDGTVGGTVAGAPAASAPAASASAPAGAASAPGASGGSGGSATPPGSVPTMTLSGCASSQAEVALTLQRLRLMDGVSAVSLQSSAKGEASGSGAASSTGNCQPQSPVFTVQITFEPLPAPSASTGSGSELTAANGGEK